jgi:ribonuclease BN (tRNA processing enzyme)
VARQAGAKRLILCHLGTGPSGREDALQQEAMQSFEGSVELPEELREYRV